MGGRFDENPGFIGRREALAKRFGKAKGYVPGRHRSWRKSAAIGPPAAENEQGF